MIMARVGYQDQRAKLLNLLYDRNVKASHDLYQGCMISVEFWSSLTVLAAFTVLPFPSMA